MKYHSTAVALALGFRLSDALELQDIQLQDMLGSLPLNSSTCSSNAPVISLGQITGERIYTHDNAPDANANANISHRDYTMSSSDTCGFLINESSTISIVDSKMTKPAYTGTDHLPPIYYGAAVCVVNQSTFNFDHGSVTTHSDLEAAVWAKGLNTTVHVTDLAIETKAEHGYGLVADNEAVLFADGISYYANNTVMACAFDADGGEITVHQSVAHLQGAWATVFCSFGGGDSLGQIHSQDVHGLSEKGPAVTLSGNTWLAAFTNTTLASGLAVVQSSRIGTSKLNDTVVHFTSSSLTTTSTVYPVLLFIEKNIEATFHRTQLIPSPSTNMLLHVACGVMPANNQCAPFRAMVLISESTIMGDIAA